MAALRRLTAKGAIVLAIHHSAKALDGFDYRGSSEHLRRLILLGGSRWWGRSPRAGGGQEWIRGSGRQAALAPRGGARPCPLCSYLSGSSPAPSRATGDQGTGLGAWICRSSLGSRRAGSPTGWGAVADALGIEGIERRFLTSPAPPGILCTSHHESRRPIVYLRAHRWHIESSQDVPMLLLCT